MSVSRIEISLGLSEPYLYQLFRDKELSLSRVIWSARLDRCRKELQDPLQRHLERFQPDCTVDPGRFARGTALRLLAMARHVASTRLVPQANRLGLASHSQAESALEACKFFDDTVMRFALVKVERLASRRIKCLSIREIACLTGEMVLAFGARSRVGRKSEAHSAACECRATVCALQSAFSMMYWRRARNAPEKGCSLICNDYEYVDRKNRFGAPGIHARRTGVVCKESGERPLDRQAVADGEAECAPCCAAKCAGCACAGNTRPTAAPACA
ncbi:MAG: hypothetical protein V7642_3509, partial [Burkholderiales bacterium]